MPRASLAPNPERGSTLLDLIFAVALLGLLVGVLVPALITGREGVAVAGTRGRATLLADEGLQAVRNLHQSGATTLTAGTHGLATTGGQWSLSGTADTIDQFTRTINITPVDASRTDVTATVTWQQTPARTGSVSVMSRFTNWLRQVVVQPPLPAERIAYYQADTKDLKYGSCQSNCDVGTNWSTVIVDHTGDVGQFASLALDVDKPRVSYWDESNKTLKYAACDTSCTSASNWTSVTIEPAQGGQDLGRHTALAIEAGQVHIAYYDFGGKRLKYARCDTTCTTVSNWTTTVVESGNQVGEYASLALDAGRPRVSYWDATNKDLKYGSCDTQCTTGSNWTTTVVDASGDTGQFSSLGLVGGQPRISYYRATSSDLKYAGCDTACTSASNWTSVVVDSTGQVGKYTALAFDAGKPRIGYWKENSKNLKYAGCDTACTSASNWGNTNVATADDIGSYSSLAIQEGSPRLAYRDTTNLDLNFAICQTDCLQHPSWSTVTVDSAGDTGLYPSLNR